MGEIKSVKVDNWGVFFLQKLQNFFNKTDYCDLTLQFRDNSQLKVHRLVLSACTDFFNVLEQTCELIDDALVMPIELQADVVVPIVNFMYTGTLEFELKMYSKLLKTAKEMNMTVLLKLLEAHKRTMDGSKPVRPVSPKNRGKRVGTSSPSLSKLTLSPSTVSSTQQPRRIMTGQNSTPWRRIVSVNENKPMQGTVFRQTTVSSFIKSPKMQKGPTRFETVDTNLHGDSYESSFDPISYESKPLKEEPEEYEERRSPASKNRSSPFEQLRKGFNNNKRPAISTFTSPPAKKPNIEDVKEFSEQQRMRKQIAAEYGDDAEYDGVMDDEFHNDDDDDEAPASGPSASAARQQQPQASIIIKQSANEKPTIVVKDSSNSKMDHAKIISEVLRQYPHLVKSNKNIKLKIMPNVGGQAQKIVVKKESQDTTESEQSKAAGLQAARQQLQHLSQKQQLVLKAQPSKLSEAQPSGAAAGSATTSTGQPQKRRIDSKTMHTLIALGAENTTGPWLCLRCGINGRPISIPSYRGFRRHLINTHKETIDSALCEHCGWRSTSSRVLAHHIFVEHKVPTSMYSFPKCSHCPQICVDNNDLEAHIGQAHPDIHNQQCIYCNKIFVKEMQLYNHMKAAHKKRAREDGVIDFSDDEMDADYEDDLKDMEPESTTADKKIKIISDISLPSTIIKLEEPPAPVEEEYANDNGPKFVNADGNEMVLTAEQREEIMSQLDQDHEGGVVMVLNESAFPQGDAVVVGQEEGEAAIAGNDTSVDESALEVSKEVEEEEQHESEPQESEHDERMEEDHMEWAENVLSAHDADDHEEDEEEDDDEEDEEQVVKKTATKVEDKKEEEKVSSSKEASVSVKEEKKEAKKEDDISMKLKMLTGDWSDDDEEDAEGNEKETSEDAIEAAETSTSDEVKKVLEETEDESQSKEIKPVPEDNETEEMEDDEETETKPTQSEKEEEHDDEEVKDEIPDNEEESEEPTNSTQEPLQEPDTTTKVDVKRKLSTASGGSASSRRTSAKDELKHLSDEEKQVEKAEDVKQELSEEGPLAALSELEDIKSPEDTMPEVKVEEDESVAESAKPTTDDSIKTVDKVKSIISDWVDDEDDI